jgi:hypothetical protein
MDVTTPKWCMTTPNSITKSWELSDTIRELSDKMCELSKEQVLLTPRPDLTSR